MAQSKISRVLALLVFVCLGLPSMASVTNNATDKTTNQIHKEIKKQERMHKKAFKIQKRIQKAKIKAGAENMSDAEFLQNADDRVRYGLIGILGGIVLLLILKSSLQWIGIVAVVAGIGLLIWLLLEA
ncbi:MAG: hypothetical protein KJP00_08010 [Bacteroidia bacterium]|nr:hypothetical protein [Bacteroidia bacterium]